MAQPRCLRGWLLAGLTGICLVHEACALDPARAMSQYVHESWGTDRGFLGGAVYAISQSADGYLWIGTERGLVRFDGVRFTLIQRPLPSAPSLGPVLGLLSDEQGNLWIRFEGPHLLLYHGGILEDALARFNIEQSTFTAMSADGEGGLLLNALGNRTFRLRNGSVEEIPSAEEVPGTILSLAVTRDHRMWMGTRDDGLFHIGEGHANGIAPQLTDMKINALQLATNGGLWIGTDHGIFLWDGGELADTRLPSFVGQLEILSMTRDREGNVWAGTDKGLMRITASRSAAIEPLNHGAQSRISAVFEDREGEIWYGGSQGIERLRDGMFTTYGAAQGLPSDSNGPIYADPSGRVWFAPLAGGLYWIKDGRVGQVALAGLSNDVVYSICGGGGEIWVGRQRGGLTLLKQSGASFVARSYTQAVGLAQDSVYTVHRNRDETLWAGTVSGGISRLKNGIITNYSTANGLASNAINSIVESYDGSMWFATPNGLQSFSGGKWSNRTERDGLPSSNVKSIFEDAKQVLWIATSGGLAYLAAGKIAVPRHLPESLREQIVGMAEDDLGYLWIVTSDHVLRVARAELLADSAADASVRSYGITDGLDGVEGVNRDRSMVSDSTGHIWISLNRRLAVASPQLTMLNSMPAAARIDSLTAGGASIDFRQSPRIAPGSRSITFDFGGASLVAPDQVRFRYKLDGADQNWSGIVTSREVTYNNLSPGRYQFRIIASNGENLWNGPQTAVAFVVERAFWQTWWFSALCVSAVILLLLAIYRLRMYQITRQLSSRFHERLAERTRIARDLHDTLLQGVLSASMQLDLAEDQLPDDSPSKPRLKRVMELLGKVTEEGRGTLHALRSTDRDKLSLERAFSFMKRDLGNEEEIDYRVVVRGEPVTLRPFIRDEVYRIGREALVNAFRHAHANSIEVEVEYASRQFRMVVRDDGSGIAPEVLNQGREGHWGLPGIRERSEGIGATLRLMSRVGAGTELELTIPGTVAFEKQRRGSRSAWRRWLSREKSETDPSNGIKR